MATLTLYEVTIPTFTKGLKTLSHILNRAVEHGKEIGVDPETYVTARLYEDMNPLAFQVQNATNNIKRTVARLEGGEFDAWPATEKTIADLQARIEKAQELLRGVNPEVVNERADALVDFPLPAGSVKVPVKRTVLNQAIPNFFFHVQTAYAILRSNGVPIGKKDYLGGFLEES